MTKALVLSGGGPVGIAWQSGLAAGLAGEGVDWSSADFILGTSAGSAVGAQLALGRDMQAVTDRYRARGEARSAPTKGAGGGQPDLAKLMEVMAKAQSDEGTDEERRAGIGAFALEADTAPEESFVSGFAHLDGEARWPDRFACTAVDAHDGTFMVWNGQPGVALSRAVASSCAVPGIFPPITINGRRYIDGGMRSGTNADLAKDHDRVLVVTLLGGMRAPAGAAPNARMERYRKRAEAEAKVLTDAGCAIERIGPDEESAAAIGGNLMDSRNAVAAAEAGLRQGKLEADRLRAFWS